MDDLLDIASRDPNKYISFQKYCFKILVDVSGLPVSLTLSLRYIRQNGRSRPLPCILTWLLMSLVGSLLAYCQNGLVAFLSGVQYIGRRWSTHPEAKRAIRRISSVSESWIKGPMESSGIETWARSLPVSSPPTHIHTHKCGGRSVEQAPALWSSKL